MSNNKNQSQHRLSLPTELKSLSALSLRATLGCGIFPFVVFLSSCTSQTYQPEPVSQQQVTQQRVALDHRDPAFRNFLQKHDYPVESWPLTQFDLAALTLAAMKFNPTLQLAQSRIDIARAGEAIAGQKSNPTLNFPDEPRDTADFYGLVVDFIFERKAKREARQAKAKATREAAEFELAQQAWSIYSDLHANLIEYYAAGQVSDLLKNQQMLVKESLELLKQHVDAGQVSEFEMSSLRLELQQTALQLASQQYLVNDALHRLIRDTGLQVDKFKENDFVFSDLKRHLRRDALEVEQLQTELLHSRFDINRKLAEYQAYEAGLKLEIEKQYPDVTLSPGFLFEDGQSLWVLAASGVWPLFHNNDGQIQRALAARKAKQYEFIQMQTTLINELARKKQNYLDRLAAYEQSQQLFTALRTRGREIEKQFELGYSDRLNLLRSHLEIEKARHTMFQIEIDAMRAAVQLERLIQSPTDAAIKKFNFMQFRQAQENK